MRILAFVIALCCCSAARADLVIYDLPDQTVCFVVNNASALVKVDATQGSGDRKGEYRVTDTTLAGVPLAAGEYSGRAYASNAAGVNVLTMAPLQVIPGFRWSGTAVLGVPANFSAMRINSSGYVDALFNGTVSVGQDVVDAIGLSAATQTLGAALASYSASGTVGQSLNWMKDAFSASGVFKPTALVNAPVTAQPRINLPPDPGFILKVPKGNDGNHTVAQPVNLPPGTVGSITVALDMSDLFGQKNLVTNVGAAVVSGGSIVATGIGPHDYYGYVTLTGTATAGETRTVTVPVTVASGSTVSVKFTIKVGS
jgi:hypothetical protein